MSSFCLCVICGLCGSIRDSNSKIPRLLDLTTVLWVRASPPQYNYMAWNPCVIIETCLTMERLHYVFYSRGPPLSRGIQELSTGWRAIPLKEQTITICGNISESSTLAWKLIMAYSALDINLQHQSHIGGECLAISWSALCAVAIRRICDKVLLFNVAFFKYGWNPWYHMWCIWRVIFVLNSSNTFVNTIEYMYMITV